MREVRVYRVVSFGRPLAPWRTDRQQVCRDLIELGLGGYDEWGKFFISVPGDVEKRDVAEDVAARLAA